MRRSMVVTGDHETGGLTIGYAEHQLRLLPRQPRGAEDQLCARLTATTWPATSRSRPPSPTPWQTSRSSSASKPPKAAQGEEGGSGTLVLTDYELGLLQDSYERTLAQAPRSQDEMTQEEYVHYGTYEPFSVTLTHVLNHKVGRRLCHLRPLGPHGAGVRPGLRRRGLRGLLRQHPGLPEACRPHRRRVKGRSSRLHRFHSRRGPVLGRQHPSNP